MAGELVPDVTNLVNSVSSSWDAGDILHAIYIHINNGSSKWQVVNETGTPQGSDGLTITPTAVSQDFQLNLRRLNADDFNVSLELSGAITDPGNTSTAPTPTGGDFSGEVDWRTDINGVPATGSHLWCVETSDHITFLVTDSARTQTSNGIHAGRIYVPFDENLIGLGRDGLGLLADTPDLPSSTDTWLSSTTSGKSLIHIESGSWGVPSISIGAHDEGDANSGLSGETIVTTYPFYITAYNGTEHSPVGTTKYYRFCGFTNEPFVILSGSNSDQGWMHIDDAGASEEYVLIWDKNVSAL